MKPSFWNSGKLYLSKNDRILKKIIQKYQKENINVNSNYFECLINSIIGQQISVKAANSIKDRFFSMKLKINPKNISSIDKRKLRKIGLSNQKVNYVKNLSIFFLENSIFIKNIDRYENEEIRRKLILIKGIGNWTIDMFLIFSLSRSNIFPVGDLGLLKAISINYKKKLPLKEKTLDYYYKKWSPYSTVATWYLWRSLDPLPINY